ncbi:MAG: tRNA pseudouridine(55) synthase TruB [Cycloclasticus sp. symbiont of Poecilosclerida sp. M]|nr:MAG: tRNA pseudouridine(55) synthase TruB [Cycloclasticus sp. symbiont of Poecilosclerida sp. M]
MSRRKKTGRDISGIVILDKPLELSSNHAVQRVKRLFNANKAGHTGSLDPLASGVLPICLGHATKVSSYLLASDKTYQFTMHLGQTTSTGDSEGEVLKERPVPSIIKDELLEILQRFTGHIQQIPPMYSALKHEGQRLYKLARQGQSVERPARSLEIKALQLIVKEKDSLTLEATCSKGTYIRVLAEDIGEAIGCGAYVMMLRRLVTGPFRINESVTLDKLQSISEKSDAGNFLALDEQLQSLDAALQDYPSLQWVDEYKQRLCQGQAVVCETAPKQPLIRLYGQDDTIFGLGKWCEPNLIAPIRIFD